MDFEMVLNRRCSTRKFLGQPLEKEQIGRLIMAANRAPVGSNLYRDIHLTVVQDQNLLLRLCEAAWVRFTDRRKQEEIAGEVSGGTEIPAQKPNLFYGAPLVIFISHRKQTLQPGIEFANAASVANQIHLAAADMGLGSCYMWGALESMRMFPAFDHTDLLELPDDFQPLLGVAVGYPEEPLKEHELRHEPFAVNYL